MLALRVAVFGVGLAIAGLTFASAVRTVVVPRGQSLLLQRLVFRGLARLLRPAVNRAPTARAQDRILVHHAPFGLVLLAVTWVLATTVGFAFMYWGIGVGTWREAFRISGSSVTTLGFASTGTDWPGTVLEVLEAVIGLILVALLISFLPTIYGLFSERERIVTYMAVRAGTPPSGTEMLERFHRIGALGDTDDIWGRFEEWFNELAETHTSFMALPFFRSPNPDRSWLTTGGAVLDAASLHLSCLDLEADRQAALCLRSGYIALNEIARAYGFEVPDDPSPDDPISVSRSEFDAAMNSMAAAGLPLVADHDQAWRAFRGWRVNYDVALVTLAAFVTAPYAPWSSDRSIRT